MPSYQVTLEFPNTKPSSAYATMNLLIGAHSKGRYELIKRISMDAPPSEE